jgi:hypothetical protein
LLHLVQVFVDSVDIALIDRSPLALIGSVRFDEFTFCWIYHRLELAMFVMFEDAIIEHILDLGYHMLTIRYLFIQSPHFLLHGVDLLHLIKHLLMLVCLALLLFFYLSL